MSTSKFTAGRNKGRCCSGKLCKFPTMQLCKEHICVKCKKILHVLCGDPVPGSDDSICKKCSAIAATPVNEQSPPTQRTSSRSKKIPRRVQRGFNNHPRKLNLLKKLDRCVPFHLFLVEKNVHRVGGPITKEEILSYAPIGLKGNHVDLMLHHCQESLQR